VDNEGKAGASAMTEIYTIGHSTHSFNAFIGLLYCHGINAVADVRSAPYSRRNPQFNREDIRAALRLAGIQYAFLGKELGARTKDDGCYVNGRVCYSLLSQTQLFRSGIERLVEGTRSHRIALMCAEKEPIECHRTILVSRHLVLCGFDILHILATGAIERHEDALKRLRRRLNIVGEDMFRSSHITTEEAYERQGARIAYDRNRR
jgi:uncharacterized protein (DUF488 family)